MSATDFEMELAHAKSYLAKGKLERALSCFQKLVRDYPCNGEIWFKYGSTAFKTGRHDLAEQAWNRVEKIEPNNSELLLQIGHQYNGDRKPEKARSYFERAASANASAINPRISLGLLFEETQQFDAARAKVEECLAIDPHDEQARYLSALLDFRTDKLAEAERTLCELLAREPGHEYVRYAARHVLAEVLDRTGRFDEAMRHLMEAKKIMRALLPDPDSLIHIYDNTVKENHADAERPKDFLRKWAKTFPESKRLTIQPLAFLGGHPRSGTTLLEQILDAHPGIAAADEPLIFNFGLYPAFKGSNPLTTPRLNILRRNYMNGLLGVLGDTAKGKLLVDKNPSPTANLPVWLQVFPELRVIIALRDPRDVVISCYFQNLPLNAISLNFLSIERIARHYVDLMAVWLTVREWENFAWIETHYEDTVADVEKEGRRITEFLGLAWAEEQASFNERRGKKKLYAPTYHDVTRPIHSRSVARWRSYEKYIEPVLPILEPFCRAFGYD